MAEGTGWWPVRWALQGRHTGVEQGGPSVGPERGQRADETQGRGKDLDPAGRGQCLGQTQARSSCAEGQWEGPGNCPRRSGYSWSAWGHVRTHTPPAGKVGTLKSPASSRGLQYSQGHPRLSCHTVPSLSVTVNPSRVASLVPVALCPLPRVGAGQTEWQGWDGPSRGRGQPGSPSHPESPSSPWPTQRTPWAL